MCTPCLASHLSLFLCARARFVQLTVTWSCMGVCLCVLILCLPQDAADVGCVCVCGIVWFCKLERRVAGWNPIRVYCQHAAVLTWYACYSNLVVKNRLSLGYFSGEFAVLKPPWLYISFLQWCFVIISTVFFSSSSSSSLLCRIESWCQRR